MEPKQLVITLVIGFVAGWLAAKVVKGTSLGIVGDVVVGVVGAFVGSWLLPKLGIYLGGDVVGRVITATIGAALLLFLMRLIKR